MDIREIRNSNAAAIEGSVLSLPELEVLSDIERRILWMATSIVHHANNVRPNPSGVKVGGHQASSASMTSIMTALWFANLRAEDRVSVKPHASPVLHAIQYLLGNLDREYLTELRSYGGLQSYPSRTKDPYPVDFSTGSVGLGATAPIWAAIARRYVGNRFGEDVDVSGRQIALIGDAELDEGACWEAIADPVVSRLGELMWVVDLNRQTLDRIVPEIAVDRMKSMFEAAGWHTVTVKYGRFLEALFERDGGDHLRRRIDRMSNTEYQRLLRVSADELRERLPGEGRGSRELTAFISELRDRELTDAFRNLGGHDLDRLVRAFREAESVTDRPTVVFAYTLKGWRLPIEGHPANHSALLTTEQYEKFADLGDFDAKDPWARPEEGGAEDSMLRGIAQRLRREEPRRVPAPEVIPQTGRDYTGLASTQQELGRLLSELPRANPEAAKRIVTVSPDVASSTNLGGWINKVGIWSTEDRRDWFSDDPETLLRWRESGSGQHIELGIAEVNLVGAIGELGYEYQRDGQPLFPIGTIYDPFVNRALEPWSFGIYGGGQSILIGTPSGVTLAPEGGAHQSVSTPSIGIEQPGCVAYEPAFGQDLEWTFLHALGRLGKPASEGGTSGYFRLSTRPLNQSLAGVPKDERAREQRRRQVISGGYRLRDARERGREPVVTLVGIGAIMPEVIRAADILQEDGGIEADVVCVTSADLLFRALQSRKGLWAGEYSILDELFPDDRKLPMVTVMDGHPHALSFLGAAQTVATSNLGVSDFGQSGNVNDLYEHYGIDPETIVGAALDLIGSDV